MGSKTCSQSLYLPIGLELINLLSHCLEQLKSNHIGGVGVILSVDQVMIDFSSCDNILTVIVFHRHQQSPLLREPLISLGADMETLQGISEADNGALKKPINGICKCYKPHICHCCTHSKCCKRDHSEISERQLNTLVLLNKNPPVYMKLCRIH